jgi:hypothetical protein
VSGAPTLFKPGWMPILIDHFFSFYQLMNTGILTLTLGVESFSWNVDDV